MMTIPIKVSRVIPNIAVSMEEWQYTFDPVSKEDWIRQIESDLRQKPLSSLQSEWWPDEPLTPLVHADDVAGESIRLPDHFFNHPPLISEYINAKGVAADIVNHQILEALRQGAQSIILHTNLTEGIADERWFTNVMKEIVILSVQPDMTSQDTKQLLSGNNPDNLLIRINRNEGSPPFHILFDLLSTRSMAMDSFRFVYQFPSSGIWDVETAKTFNRLLIDFNSWTSAGMRPDAFFNQCILAADADTFYFKHIIQSRVLHLLWLNIKDNRGIETSEKDENYLECHIQQNGENPDHFLIRASMSALAASLSGTHALCIHHDDDPAVKPFYRRINRNIHHLLSLESGMYKGKDPLSGAFAIDFHCRNWTKKIWDKLSLEK